MSEAKVANAYRIGAQTADAITIDITGNFMVGATNEEINSELDKWVGILGRQRAKTVLIGEEEQLRKDKRALEIVTVHVTENTGKTLVKTSERAQAENVRAQRENLIAQIAAREEGIASLKELTA